MAGFGIATPKSPLQRRAEAFLARWWGQGAEVLRKTRTGRFLLDCIGAALLVARGFLGEKISLRASALTYITMLSTVPFLTVAFAIVRGLGEDSLRRSVHDFIYANLAPGARETTTEYLDAFIERANAGAVGGLGGFFLLVSAISLLNNIEVSLNEIWGASKPRFIGQRIVIYWCILTFGPIALGISLATNAYVQQRLNIPAIYFTAIPFFTTILLFTFLYFFAPNAPVRFRAALGGGLVGGGAWELAKHLYAHYATQFFKYDKIYGAVGQLPIFLLWVYTSWLLLLFGARLAYALQSAVEAPSATFVTDARGREILCARIALAASMDFLAGREATLPSSICHATGVSPGPVREAIHALKEAGLLAETNTGGVVPTRPPSQIRLLDVSRAARGTLFGHEPAPPSSEPTTLALAALFLAADKAGTDELARTDLATLAQPLVVEGQKLLAVVPERTDISTG